MDGWGIAGVIAESVASLGAVLAVVVAVVTMRREQEGQRRAQASRVALSSTYITPDPEDRLHTVVELRVDNLSDLPIYNVQFCGPSSSVRTPDESKELPESVIRTVRSVQRIEPGGHKAFQYEWTSDAYRKGAVTFTDASGLHWHRRTLGGLTPHKPIEFPDFEAITFKPRPRS